MSEIKVSGFTMVRNAFRLDYPFEESLLSLLPLCDELVINCGNSNDGTEEFCESFAAKFPQVRLIRSVWEENNQKGGFQLKSQTDRALKECRGDWCFYLQADEVLHEADYEKVRKAITLADNDPEIDGIAFDYCHFYGSYEYEIRGRNWYRREVRLIKNHRHIAAFRDAQGFRKEEKRILALRSGARVFHYGYVRSSQSLQTKSGEMSKWWGENQGASQAAFQLKRHVGLSRYQKTHPAVMRERISRHGGGFDPRQCPRVWNKTEIKNLLTIVWETFFPYRIGEFRNFDLKSL